MAEKRQKSDAWKNPEFCAAILADTPASLQKFGHIVDQETMEVTQYDPFRVTKTLQATILSYYHNPPRNEAGYTRLLTLLAARQTGKSVTAEYGIYPIAAYKPGWRHSCVADIRERADTLHERVQFLHKHWDEAIRTPTETSTETRSLSFVNKSKMIVQSAHTEDFGIGQSLSSFHGSEIPWWANAGKAMSMMLPSLINRRDVLMINESTPAPMSEPSAEYWQMQCLDAKRWAQEESGRDLYAFFPFWDSYLNRRPWRPNWKLDLEEQRLMDEYGQGGTKCIPGQGFLEIENLAFRREMLLADKVIRRNPDLFKVFYPFDDLSCWNQAGVGVIRSHILERHVRVATVEFQAPLHIFKEPVPGAIYVMGVDPSGGGVRDHASFVVLEVWSDRWEVVASYSATIDTIQFQNVMLTVARKYNAILAIERNGVGMSTLDHARRERYARLYYDDKGKPGIASHAHDRNLENMIDALMDLLVIFDRDLVSQLMSYRNDKAIEQDVKGEALRLAAERSMGRGRRERHHWDKVSALMMACLAARTAPRRIRDVQPKTPTNIIPMTEASFNVWETYRKKASSMDAPRDTRTRYTSFRKRR